MLEEQKRRGRPPKSETEQRRRRKRQSHGEDLDLKMAVNPAMLDHKQFVYRWINDKDARILRTTQYDDWAIMTQDGGELKEDATDRAGAISYPVGAKKDGSPMFAYLCRKPRQFYEADQTDKQTELDKQLERLAQGKSVKTGEAESDYVPHAGIKVS